MKETQKEIFINLLLSTRREGIESVISELEKLGFFQAPASAGHHLNVQGGLLEHSLNVYNAALDLRNAMLERRPELEEVLNIDSVVIASLLHDVCKSDIYKETLTSRKNEHGYWIKEPGYTVDCSELPLGHGEKSVIMLLSWGLKLTRDEMLAIRWHMTAWDLAFQNAEAKSNLNMAKNQCPLLTIIQCADGIASAMFEEVL
jgi:hypothetical protein